MANMLVKPHFLLRKRCYVVAVESLRSQVGGGTKVKAKPISDDDNKDEIFWTRDPKSGNWIPENHFDDLDVADLREKFLPKRRTKSSN